MERLKGKLKNKSEWMYKRLFENENVVYTGYVLNVQGISIRSVPSEEVEEQFKNIAEKVEKKFGEAGLRVLEKLQENALSGRKRDET